MSIIIDKNSTFELKLSGSYVIDYNEKIIVFKILPEGNIKINCVCTGRDFERMSNVVEAASIINAINGKPMLRTSVLCRLILINFINEIEVLVELKVSASAGIDGKKRFTWDLLRIYSLESMSISEEEIKKV